MVGKRRLGMMEFPRAAQNDDQLKFGWVARETSSAIAVPSLSGEEFAGGQQMLAGIRRMQSHGGNFPAASFVEASHVERLLKMQFAGFPGRVDAAVIVNPVSQIGIFLDFAHHHARENSMLRASFDEKGFSRADRVAHKKV